MENKTDGKTVQLKELPDDKIRIFRNRDSVIVPFPDSVRAKVDGAPLSVEITPMTHRDAELRKRVNAGISKAEKRAISACGISYSEYIKFTVDAIDTNSKIFEKVKDGKKIKLKLTSEEQTKLQDDFNKKWDKVNKLLLEKDDTGVWEAEDKVLENSVRIVANNCKFLHFDDGVSVSIDNESIDSLHPDLFQWVLTQIEDISYLKSGEVLGLR